MLSQLNFLMYAEAFGMNSDLSIFDKYLIVSIISSSESSPTKFANDPPISVKEEFLQVITGVPHANDSRIGKPKPSSLEGKSVAMAKIV